MISSEIVVSVSNVSKVYKLYDKPFDRVTEALNFFGKKYHKDFYALSDVSFELKKGEALGVIGKNGNGKSTLLKLIAKVLVPTSGSVKTKGKISAILELTSNLKLEMTGLENIHLNLRLSGFKGKEIQEKAREIIEFADIGEFIKQPVKMYSSGMRSRLGFGIATSVDPDVLILDEVLAVGDFDFQQKCLSRINSMRDHMTILFVSHSMNNIRMFCDRAIVLEKGCLSFDGDPEGAIKYYLDRQNNRREKSVNRSFYGQVFHNENKISQVKALWHKKMYRLNEKMVLEFSFHLKYKPRNLIIGIPLWSAAGNFVTSFNTDSSDIEICVEDGVVRGKLLVDCVFNPGEYVSVISIVDGSEFLHRGLNNGFSVAPKERLYGCVTLPHEWDFLT